MRNTFCTLDEIVFEKTPQILLIYLEMEFAGNNAAFDFQSKGIYLRPTLGMQYLVGVARGIGVEAVVIDNRIHSFDEKMLAKFIETYNIQLVGFYTSFAHTDVNSRFVINLKKLTDIPVIAGGPGYTEHEQLLHAGVDVVVRGEGEETFKELIQRVQKGGKRDWSDIDGINYIENSDFISSPDRQLLNPDDISFPVRDNLFSPFVYTDFVLPGARSPYITMFTNRGCPHICTFCDSPNIWSHTVRHRTPDNVLAEIDYAVDQWGVRFIDMVDDVFGIDPIWVEEFCTKLIERKYDLKYKILMNPHTFGDKQKKMVKLLARSGCNNVGIGMQSAELKTIFAIKRKSDTPDRLISSIKACKENGMLTFVSFIVGFPTDSKDAADNIISLVKKAKPTVIDCYPLVFLKGTELEQSLSKGDVLESHTYEKRFRDAKKVRRSFYLSPTNILIFLFWLLKNNPGWLIYMSTKMTYLIRFVIGKKEDLIKATDNKKRVKEILERKIYEKHFKELHEYVGEGVTELD